MPPKTTPPTRFAAILTGKIERLTNRGLLEKDIAKKIGISAEMLSGRKAGRSEPTLGELLKWSTFFGCTVDELLDRPESNAAEVELPPTPTAAELDAIARALRAAVGALKILAPYVPADGARRPTVRRGRQRRTG